MEVSEQIQNRKIVKKHMTVRIPMGLTKAIGEFLNTEEAGKMGYHSRAAVVTAAVRSLLKEYGYYTSIEKKEKA
jgi:hypothetical protein